MYNKSLNEYYTTMMTQVKDIIYSARVSMQLNQKEFSKILSKSQAMVSKYESGESIPPGNILKLCQDMLHNHSVNHKDSGSERIEMDELIRLIKRNFSGDEMADAREAIHYLITAVAKHAVQS